MASNPSAASRYQSASDLRREKNRLKQKSLRQRRTDRVIALEKTAVSLQSELSRLRGGDGRKSEGEQESRSRIQLLESILNEHGLFTEVNELRQKWGDPESSASTGESAGYQGSFSAYSLNANLTNATQDAGTSSSSASGSSLGHGHPPWATQESILYHAAARSGGPISQTPSSSSPSTAGVPLDTSSSLSQYQIDYARLHETFFPEQPLVVPDVHPAVSAARTILLKLLPNQQAEPTLRMPPLNPAQQEIILQALVHLSPGHDSEACKSRQLSQLPYSDAKTLLEYQSTLHLDQRLGYFPIPILRSRIIRILNKGLPFDLTTFINSTLSSARIFGLPIDNDAWEMSDEYWNVWEGWFRHGRKYCYSLAKHRRRDGHTGSTVCEIILGSERAHSRRDDIVGRPIGWSFRES